MYSLGDVVSGTSNSTNFDEDKIICQKVLSKLPDIFGESGAKHEGLAWNYNQIKSKEMNTVFSDIC